MDAQVVQIINPEEMQKIPMSDESQKEKEDDNDDGKGGGSVSPDVAVLVHDYHSEYVPASEFTPQRQRSSWPEKRLLKLLDLYIKEHPVYLKAKVERQITEYHEYIGQMVNTEGVLVAGLLKNLSREYRKSWNSCGGNYPEGAMKLRGSQELFEKFEQYYKLYNRSGPHESWKSNAGTSRKSTTTLPMPKIKKLKKATTPAQHAPSVDPVTPLEVKIPQISVLSEAHSREFIEAVREQTRALVEIGKELRLMRMGYFTEHELAMDG